MIGPTAPGASAVVAPPGSGKTTLLAHVAAHSAWQVGWCSLGPEDRTTSALFRHLAAAASVPVPAAPGGGTLQDLTAALDGRHDRVLLVLDDVHELVGSVAEDALADLVRLRPVHVRLVLGARRLSALNVPRLMLTGELLALDGDALRFRSWEVEELFRLVYEEPLAPEAAAELTRRTGGWAAGLKLFHLATVGRPPRDRDRAVHELGGRSRLTSSYLARNVLNELDEPGRGFLVRTSSLGVLTGPLCDALLETTGSAEMLNHLDSRQFFIQVSDDGRTYRYHQVLQTYLEGLLDDELGPDRAAQIRARSGQLLEESGHAREAMRAYALADDWASVARLVQSSGACLDERGLGPERTPCPADDPWLALSRARRLLRDGSVGAAVAAYQEAEQTMDDPGFLARCAEEREQASVWLSDTSSLRLSPTPRGRRQGLGEQLRRITLGVSAQVAGTVPEPDHPLARALRRVVSGDLPSAEIDLATVADFERSTSIERLGAALVNELGQVVQGRATDPVARLEEIGLSAAVDGQPWLARLARGFTQAVLMVVRPAEWRPDGCLAVEQECRERGDHWGAMLLAFATGVACAVAGDPRAGLAHLHRAEQSARDLDARVIEAWAAIVAARIAETLEQPDAAAVLASAHRLVRELGLGTVDQTVQQLARATLRASPHTDVSPQTGERRTRPTDDTLRVRCLGAFALEVDSRALDIGGLKPRSESLLLLLAAHRGRPVHREVLCEALWPAAPPEAARHRLHVAASDVRGALSRAGLDDAVQRHGEAYRLWLEGASWDVDAFEDCLRLVSPASLRGDEQEVARLRGAALDWYRGELLPEAGPAEWVVNERERLRMLAADAAIALAGQHVGAGDTIAAAAAAQRALDIDPLRDSAWDLLAGIQRDAGDVSAASRTLHRRLAQHL